MTRPEGSISGRLKFILTTLSFFETPTILFQQAFLITEAEGSIPETDRILKRIETRDPDPKKLNQRTIRSDFSTNPSPLNSQSPSNQESLRNRVPHNQEQLSKENDYSLRIIAAGHELRNIRSRMNRLTKMETYQELEDLLRTAAGNRSVAQPKLNQLSVCAPNEWEFFSKHAYEAIAEMEISVTKAANKLPAGR